VNQTAALFFANASPRSLGTGNGVASSGASVNNAGELVGTVFSSTDGSSTSCYNQIAIFDGHGGAQQFASNALAVAVNSSGTILYDIYNGISLNCREGTISVAEYPSNAVVPFPANAANDNGTSGGNGINDLGDVVGFYRDSNFNNAGFYYHNGTSTELLLTGYSFTAWGINNNEVIVGTATPSGPGNTRAYAWSNGTFTDLNTRLAAGCQQWSILTAHAINTQGYIVGTALLNNQLHGVMLVPQ
jgi:probable HAF family extracellular repeat protein